MDVIVGCMDDLFGESLRNSFKDKSNIKFKGFRKSYYKDGEACPKILAERKDIEGKEVLVVFRTAQRPTKEDVVLYLHNFSRIVGNLSDKDTYNAAAVDVLMPYYALGRQDHNPLTDEKAGVKERDRGKDLGYKYVAREFKAHGARRIITFNPHFHRVFFNHIDNPHDTEGTINLCGIEIVCLSGIGPLAGYARDKISRDAIVIGPDGGSSPLADEFSKMIGLEYRILKKGRLGEEMGVKYDVGENKDMKGRDVVIVDDILSTLGTVVGTIKSIENYGKIDVYAVHAVLPEVGFDRANSLTGSDGLIRRVVATDTIDSDFGLDVHIAGEVVKFYEGLK